MTSTFDQEACEERFLELQEIVIPPKKRSPYKDREQVIFSPNFAGTIISAMRKKVSGYPKSGDRPLDLLLYVTHWRFLPNGIVLQLLGHHLKHRTHPFAQIHVLKVLDPAPCAVEKIFPNDEALHRFDPAIAKYNRYMIFDPANAKPFNVEGGVGVSFLVLPEDLRKLRD